MLFNWAIVVILAGALPLFWLLWSRAKRARKLVPESVNYHFTRKCNYNCGYCFHVAKNSYILELSEAYEGLQLLKEAGMKKINFSGGEPFLKDGGEHVGRLVEFCKRDLKLESVSIVSNGSLITEEWFQRYGEYLDILAVSCDSFNDQRNLEIGRHANGTTRDHVLGLRDVAAWCREYNVMFKINTVVSRANLTEDFRDNIRALKPMRWKVFQCLELQGENSGKGAKRNVKPYLVSDAEFAAFIAKHRELPCLVEESNKKMKDSYLILDEKMRFLNCTRGGKEPTGSILEIGVEKALEQSGFDQDMFQKRGGKYEWQKPTVQCAEGAGDGSATVDLEDLAVGEVETVRPRPTALGKGARSKPWPSKTRSRDELC